MLGPGPARGSEHRPPTRPSGNRGVLSFPAAFGRRAGAHLTRPGGGVVAEAGGGDEAPGAAVPVGAGVAEGMPVGPGAGVVTGEPSAGGGVLVVPGEPAVPAVPATA